ncbi:hypothetical protein ACOZ4N_00390 (plasmid) [Halorientalis pallida]|uniref:hypothetical protein n=1 Tax=Halorientalis pallida TaxID=2479928 RepID=UPI003C6FAD03
MSSYFLDTNVLVGYTFLHNRWQDHTQRLMSTNNTLYTGETTKYEYCVKRHPGPRNGVPLDWSKEDGVVGTVKRNLRKYKRLTVLELESKDKTELDPETVSEVFIDEFDVEEQIEHKVENYFEKELAQDCTLTDVEEALNKLINRINTTSLDRKDELRKRLKVRPRRSGSDYSSQVDQLTHLIEGRQKEYCADAHVLCDAMDLKNRRIINKIVSGDKSDMYSNREEIDAITSLSVVYLKDEFAKKPGPQSTD